MFRYEADLLEDLEFSASRDVCIVDNVALRKLQKHCVELGDTAVWAVSSAKHGNGVQQLRDGSQSTFWQSDGVLPHSIDVTLPQVSLVQYVAIMLCYSGDESYTPKKIVIRAGTHDGDLADVAVVADLNAPNGWVVARLADRSGVKEQAVWANKLCVVIVENHQNGRDTHVRGVRLFGPQIPDEYSTVEFMTAAGSQMR